MNIALAIMHLFPNANPLIDFIVQDDSDGNGPYLAQWNLEDPQPTEDEIQEAWEAYNALPAPEIQPSETELLGMQMVEKDLQLLELQSLVDMLGEQMVQNDLRLMQIELRGPTA